MAELAVYLNGAYAGLLTCDKQQHFSFQYAPEWIARENMPPLSLSLPLTETVYTDKKARPFFTNLLPESFVREAVARKLGISPRNEFALLQALGGECAGAITLLPPGRETERLFGYKELSAEEFHQLLREMPKKPFLAGEEGIRLSLAGAQHKLPVYLEDGRFFLPKGASPSSHIIKPNIQGIDQSVRNEAFCMAIAERIGLTVSPATVLTSPEEVYVVERYDRYRDSTGVLRRLHQEDFCQALGLMAETKYEAEGGPSLLDCFSLLDRFSSHPILDKKSLLQWVVFNYYIYNADAHAKNISFLLKSDEIRLAPFYDLMCTGVYEGVHDKLAMKIGNENRPRWIYIRHWERMAQAVGIGAKLVLKTLNEMGKEITEAAEKVASEHHELWGPASITVEIQNIIAKQVQQTKTALR
ncbi:MAG: type II toxin-antitoxin system HipA family toxin [Desulfobacteraceae bacterium]|nr:type II toxin-antitoxin system HipA family toxin [Desulfobacteraceae bacterium]